MYLFAYRFVLLAALVRCVIQLHRYPAFVVLIPVIVWVWWLIGRKQWQGKPGPTDWFILVVTSFNVTIFWVFN